MKLLSIIFFSLIYTDFAKTIDSIAFYKFKEQITLYCISNLSLRPDIRISFRLPSKKYTHDLLYYPGSPYPIDYKQEENKLTGRIEISDILPFLNLKWVNEFDISSIKSNIYYPQTLRYLASYIEFKKSLLRNDPYEEGVIKDKIDYKLFKYEKIKQVMEFKKEAKKLYFEILFLKEKLNWFENILPFLKEYSDIIEMQKNKIKKEDYLTLKQKLIELNLNYIELKNEYSFKIEKLKTYLNLNNDLQIQDTLFPLPLKNIKLKSYKIINWVIDSLSIIREKEENLVKISEKTPGLNLGFRLGYKGIGREFGEVQNNFSLSDLFCETFLDIPLNFSFLKNKKKIIDFYKKKLKKKKIETELEIKNKLLTVEKYKNILIQYEKNKKTLSEIKNSYISLFKEKKIDFHKIFEIDKKIENIYFRYKENILKYNGAILELEAEFVPKEYEK